MNINSLLVSIDIELFYFVKISISFYITLPQYHKSKFKFKNTLLLELNASPTPLRLLDRCLYVNISYYIFQDCAQNKTQKLLVKSRSSLNGTT